MKLIQIDNTLYIVEGDNKYKVSEESVLPLSKIVYEKFCSEGNNPQDYRPKIIDSFIDITDIQHRIDIKCTGCDTDTNKELGLNIHGERFLSCCPDSNYQAFLLPEKEDCIHDFQTDENGNLMPCTFCNTYKYVKPKWANDPNKVKAIITYGGDSIQPPEKLYSIQQIEKAIEITKNDKSLFGWGPISEAIINNLNK